MRAVLSQAVDGVAGASWPFAALALALYLGSLWIGAVRLRRLLKDTGCRVGTIRLVLVNLVGICANNLTLNSRVAGEGARLAALHATDGVSADRLLISSLYERVADFITGVPIVLIAIPAAWTIGASLQMTRSAVGVALVVVAVALLGVAGIRWLARQPLAEWWRTAVAKYTVRQSTIAWTVFCSAAIHIQDPLRLMACAAAFGVTLSLPQSALLTTASIFAAQIPTIGALGAIEGGLIAMLVALKVKTSTAIAITALERGISLVFSTAAGAGAAFWLGGRGFWRRVRGARAQAVGSPSSPDARTRVLVVCGNGPDPITLRKIEALAPTHDVHLAYWRDEGNQRAYPFSVAIPVSSVHPIDLPDPNGPPLRGLALLIRFHARLFSIAAAIRPDVVHAVNFDMLIGAWLLCLGQPDRTLVYDLLDTDERLRRWPAVLLQRLVMRRVDRTYTTSPQFVSRFLRPLGMIGPDAEPVVIPNAPWASTFEGIRARRDGPFVVGYIGSFRSEPAIRWLCESVAEVRRSGLDVEILFAGTGEARPLVEALARSHAFVRHEGAYDYARDIRSLYERVDLVFAVYDVSWDKRTHLPCRFSDAVAAGHPLVALAGTYMGDLVDAHRLGYVVDFSDPSSLTAALRDAVSRRAEWSARSRIPAQLRIEHTFEHYVPALRASYAAARARRHKLEGPAEEPAAT